MSDEAYWHGLACLGAGLAIGAYPGTIDPAIKSWLGLAALLVGAAASVFLRMHAHA